METIFTIGKKAVLWRLLAPLCLAMGVAMAWLGWGFLVSSGPVDDGPPAYVRVPLAIVFLLGGIAIAIGTCVYGLCYVSRIELDRAAGVARVHVTGWVSGRSFDVRPEDFVSARGHDGYFDGGRMAVNAPWTTVRIRGRRLPLILDDMGDFIDREAVNALLDGYAPGALLRPRRTPLAKG
ncbi:MAG TPA: hypothetical protein VJT67_12300 [Longimicrobiaceae bacterium]|nr:hypothetical protein [Longimicrobiaceae bacterium]